MPSMFGARSRSGTGMGDGALDECWKQLSAATVKFSNDTILKATGFIREALQLYKRGDKTKQDDFSRLFIALEVVKNDRSSFQYAQHMEAIGAIIPVFAVNLLSADSSKQEHIVSCVDSAQYYLNRIIKTAKEASDAANIDWASAMVALIDAFVNEDGKDTNAHSSTNSTRAQGSNPLPMQKSTLVTAASPVHKVPREEEACKLEGSRWYIRKVKNGSSPVIVTPEAINQALAVEDCTKIAIKVEGKINAVLAGTSCPCLLDIHVSSVDKCSQMDLEVADVVSSIEYVGCNRVRLFLNGKVQLVVLDGCESVQVYLSASSRSVKIVTSKCIEVNVVAPAALLDPRLEGQEEGEEYVELAIPAQFFSHINEQGKLITLAHEHVGA